MEQMTVKEEIKLDKPVLSPNFQEKEIKKVVIIIAFKDFRDQEYFVPKEILAKQGIEVKIASTQKGTAIGTEGGEAEIDLVTDEINAVDFDAVIFTGGSGCLLSFDNEVFYKLSKEFFEKGKITAAICIAPVILAKAGILKGKRATVWSSSMDRWTIKILEKNGAEFIDEKVVQDGNIITGNGPAAAEEFGKKILENLKQI